VGVVTSHNRLLEQLVIEREKQLELRAAARNTVTAVRTQEGELERAERAKNAKAHEAGGVRERLQDWRDEHREVEALRVTERAKIAEIEKKEAEDEDKLGPGMPPNQP